MIQHTASDFATESVPAKKEDLKPKPVKENHGWDANGSPTDEVPDSSQDART